MHCADLVRVELVKTCDYVCVECGRTFDMWQECSKHLQEMHSYSSCSGMGKLCRRDLQTSFRSPIQSCSRFRSVRFRLGSRVLAQLQACRSHEEALGADSILPCSGWDCCTILSQGVFVISAVMLVSVIFGGPRSSSMLRGGSV